MLFTSVLFLTIFLPTFLLLYYWRPHNSVALAFSLIFYFWGAPRFLPVVLVVGAINYALSLWIHRGIRPRLLVGLGVLMHVSVLVFYKYLIFIVSQINLFLPGHEWTLPAIMLPLGVSFITFEQISYLMDVYRGDCRPARRLRDYYLFLLLFPHSIAGPIFRWKDLEPQIAHRKLDDERIFNGFVRFIYGLGKKALIANFVGFPADRIFALPPGEVGFYSAWIAAIAYALQIYFDFSAYSDMAIGIGRMIGFNFKENFDFPYVSRSITEFWERWHISLTSFFRNYLYFPLGGNRRSTARTYFNIMVVFAVSGFWHGASWNFLVWGVFHGLALVVERLTGIGTRASEGARPSWRTLPTLILVLVGWVFFRARDLGQAGLFLKAMSGLSGNPPIVQWPMAEILPYRCMLMIFLGVVLVPLEPILYRWMERARWLFAGSVFVLSLAALANSTYNPFIYFRF